MSDISSKFTSFYYYDGYITAISIQFLISFETLIFTKYIFVFVNVGKVFCCHKYKVKWIYTLGCLDGGLKGCHLRQCFKSFKKRKIS